MIQSGSAIATSRPPQVRNGPGLFSGLRPDPVVAPESESSAAICSLPVAPEPTAGGGGGCSRLADSSWASLMKTPGGVGSRLEASLARKSAASLSC
jgi:hypothetical protein